MKTLRQFNIPFTGLTNKTHQFQFEIDQSFFQSFQNNSFDDCNIIVNLDFDKKETFFQLKFYVDGTVHLPCDRCLEPYNQEIFGDYELFVKFSDDPSKAADDEDDDIIYISRNEDHLDVSKPIYDYTLLSIPLRCVHPEDEEGISGCNKEVVAKLTSVDNDIADPRWAALEKLRNKKQ